MELSHGKHPKMIVELTKKLQTLKNTQDLEDRIEIIEAILRTLSLKLVTFGPILRVVHEEYSEYLKTLRRNIMIEEKRRIL